MIHKVLVMVPSRGRPDRIQVFIDAWREHSTMSDLLIQLDEDDPTWREYPVPEGVSIVVGPRRRLVESINFGVKELPDYAYYASLGDDHIIRTPGWDRKLVDRIEKNHGWGIAYGDDMLQHQRLPTAVVISANIIKTLGYMCHPSMEHLYADNFWKELGEMTGTLLYEPSVVIEHMHPFAHKATMDDSYAASNSTEQYDHDRQGFQEWQAKQRASDVAAVNDARLTITPVPLQ